MRTARNLVLASGAGFFLTLSGPGEKVAFHPEAGSTLKKRFVEAADFTLDDLSLVVDGQDIGGMLGTLEVTFQQESKTEVTDMYEALGEGRPKKLARTFDVLASLVQLNASAEMGGQDQEIKASSELEGETVVFTWNEEKDAYDIAFQDGQGDADLLEHLSEDMDLRALLPQAEVSADESWKVDLQDLKALAMPGGNTGLVPQNADLDLENMDMFEEVFANFGQEFADLLDGDCTCTFRGIREEEGTRLAEIGVEVDVASSVDLTELLDQVIEKAVQVAGGEAIDMSIETADLNLDFEGEGTLLWNLQAGHLHSFQISGDAKVAFDFSISVEAEGECHDMEASLEASGSISQEVETGE